MWNLTTTGCAGLVGWACSGINGGIVVENAGARRSQYALVEYLIDLLCGPKRTLFDENTGIGLKPHV